MAGRAALIATQPKYVAVVCLPVRHADARDRESSRPDDQVPRLRHAERLSRRRRKRSPLESVLASDADTPRARSSSQIPVERRRPFLPKARLQFEVDEEAARAL